MTKKILIWVFSIVLILSFVFVLTWGIINFNKVKEGISGTGIYTQEDINNSYNDGYNTALLDKENYDKIINELRDKLTIANDEKSQIFSELTALQNSNKENLTQIENLSKDKTNLEAQVENLTDIKTANENTIKDLNTSIASLNNRIDSLTASGNATAEEVANLTTELNSLRTIKNQLEATNASNLETITALNSQVQNLNKQISDMTLSMQNNNAIVSALNSKIAELQKSIKYYEEYIAGLESGDQVVATFEFNGSVYNIQILNRNAIASITNPTSTDRVVFNYWMVNNERIDLTTYQISTNTKFVANITLKYEVNFKVDDTDNKQYVIKDGFPQLPTNPTKEGYVFKGWSLNGIDVVDPTTAKVQNDISYRAVFAKIHTVTFISEDETVNTQKIENGFYVENVSIESTETKIFNGWKFNNSIVDVTTIKIVADTTFIADYTYASSVKFMVDENLYNSQTVMKGNRVIKPVDPIKEDYNFHGWSLNSQIIDLNSYRIDSDVTFTAIFRKKGGLFNENTGEKIMSWEEMLANDYIAYSKDGYYSSTVKTKELSGKLIIDSMATKYSNNLFWNCKQITSVIFPEGLTSVGGGMFGYCTSLKKVTLPSSITIIGQSAFYNCSSLTNINFPESLLYINSGAFQNCISLSGELILPNGLKKIESQAFIKTNFTSVTIPSSVTLIGIFAFKECGSLRTMYINIQNPTNVIPQAGNSITETIPDNVINIYIPKGSLTYYQTLTKWSDYASKYIEQ